MNDTDKLPFMYRHIFDAGASTLWRDSKTGGLYGSSKSDYFLMAGFCF